MSLAAEIRGKIDRLQKLRKMALVIKSPGVYQTKAQTPVADVCRYQNDGTANITPSRFIERAEAEEAEWEEVVDKAVSVYIDSGDVSVLEDAAAIVAQDISRVCDRVRTGRLKRSFEGEVDDKNGRD